jgi:hypothetical protein
MSTPPRPRRAASRTIDALRALVMCIVALATTGAVPSAVSCFEELHGCGHKMRCLCRHCPTTGVRGPCSCCDGQPGAWSRTGALEPAVVPRPSVSAPALAPLGHSAILPQFRLSFTTDVPHPPPRTHSLT